MPEQQSSAESAAPTEEAVANADANAEDPTTAPPLNREQRRAQAKGKKGGGDGHFQPGAGGPQGGRGSGGFAGVRVQRRTGGGK